MLLNTNPGHSDFENMKNTFKIGFLIQYSSSILGLTFLGPPPSLILMGPTSLANLLESLAYLCDLSRLCLFNMYYLESDPLNLLSQLLFLSLGLSLPDVLTSSMTLVFLFLGTVRKSMAITVSSYNQTAEFSLCRLLYFPPTIQILLDCCEQASCSFATYLKLLPSSFPFPF